MSPVDKTSFKMSDPDSSKKITVVTSSKTRNGYHVQLRSQMSSEASSANSSWTSSFSWSRASKQKCRYVIMLTVVMTAVLAAVIIVPVVNQNGPVHKKYLKHVVSVMSEMEQRKLIMIAKKDCFKLSHKRDSEYSNTNRTLDSPMCPVWWDDMLCWDKTEAGTLASQPCPNYVNGFNKNGHMSYMPNRIRARGECLYNHALSGGSSETVFKKFATRICTENGTWWVNPDPLVNHSWTNFTDCVKPSIDLSFHAAHGDKLRLLYTIGYSFSLGALLVAVIIMLCCKRLHSKSNTLHINLFLAFILRAVISFLKDILFVGNVGLAKDVRRGKDGILEFVHDATHWECKLLISIFMYSVNACNMWIFAEALYLTMLVYKPLATERRGVRLYVVMGWVLSLVFIIPWLVVKAVNENTFCWNIQHNPDYYWILRGSGVGVVVINFFLFLNIFRKLFLKIRHSSQLGACGKAKYRKLAKFILVLIPLFGIMYIVFYVAVPSNFEETDFNVAYLYLEMGYNSFQGFLLALLFCFLNEEVHGELKRAWHRHRSRRHEMSTLNKTYHYHSSHRKSHSTVGRGCQPNNKQLSYHNTDQHRKEAHLLRTYSISSEYGHDVTHSTNALPTNSYVCPHRALPTEKDNLPSPAASSVNNLVFPQFTDIDHSDSLLKQAMRTSIQRKLIRQSTAESVDSQSVSASNKESECTSSTKVSL